MTHPFVRGAATRKTKALPPQRKGSGSRRMLRAIGRASTLPAGPVAVGPAHSRRMHEVRQGHGVLTTIRIQSQMQRSYLRSIRHRALELDPVALGIVQVNRGALTLG